MALFKDDDFSQYEKFLKAIKRNDQREPETPTSLLIYRKAIAALPEIKELFIRSIFISAREAIIYRNVFPPYVEKEKEHLWAYENLPDFRKHVDEAIEKLVAILATKRLTE